MKTFGHLVDEIRYRKARLYERDILVSWEVEREALETVIYAAEALRKLRDANISARFFENGQGVSIFRDPSTRARFAFAAAGDLLGLGVMDLAGRPAPGSDESARETACAISFLAEVVGVRDDLAGDAWLREIAAALDEGHKSGVLPCRPALINLRSDRDNPVRALADLTWMRNRLDSDNLSGRRVALTWVYSPRPVKPVSTVQGQIALLTRFGLDVRLAYPHGYDPDPHILARAERQADESGGDFRLCNSMSESLEQADIVYPISWCRPQAPLPDPDLAAEWHLDARAMSATRNALVMHGLPACISGVTCQHGEIAADVFEANRCDIYRAASWKPYVIAAMILCRKFHDPAQALEALKVRNRHRVSLTT